MTSPDEQRHRPLNDAGGSQPLAAEPTMSAPSTSSADRRWVPADAPPALRPVAILLLANLALSIILTVATALTHGSIIEYQLDHRHITDPAVREALKGSYFSTIISRAVVNIAVSIAYAFLLRALFRGRRWAYRRVVILSSFGILGLISLLFTPYPAWIRAEQALQAIVLASLLYFATRPAVKAYFDPALPGRTVRRFNR